jgi:hypothetical protein
MKMPMLKFSIFSCLFIAFLSSCSIEKRVYMRGFHIERKHHLETGSTTLPAKIANENKTADLSFTEKHSKKSDSANPVFSPNVPAAFSSNSKQTPAKNDSLKTHSPKTHPGTALEKNRDPQENQQTNILALLSVAIGLLIIPMIVICLLLGNFTLLTTLFLIMSFLALLLGILAMAHMEKHPDVYPVKTWARFGIVLGVIEVGISILGVVAWAVFNIFWG